MQSGEEEKPSEEETRAWVRRGREDVDLSSATIGQIQEAAERSNIRINFTQTDPDKPTRGDVHQEVVSDVPVEKSEEEDK